MQTDPSGIEKDIDDPKGAIDIFVLCGNSHDAELLGEQLAPQGYRVTIFTESTHMLESVRTGKPNLLICDTTNPEFDGYEFCRALKSDYDLWIIPVLLITGTNNLGDLLKVLGSNAENFITRPYNEQYLLTLVDSVLATRVEKPDPEKIKTQFKIRYDNEEYVITADRRRLLEFLLSSFEITINQAAEIVQVSGDLRRLQEELEQRISDRTQKLSGEVDRLNVTLRDNTLLLEKKTKAFHEKEELEKNLRSTLQERDATLLENSELLASIKAELLTATSRLSETEEQVRMLTAEKDALEKELTTRIDALIHERDSVISERDRTQQLLDDETKRSMELDAERAALASEKEQQEQEQNRISLELEDIKNLLSDEKKRAAAAKEEYTAVLQEKSRIEEELRRSLEEATEKSRVQTEELDRLAGELSTEKDLKNTAKTSLLALTAEKSRVEEELRRSLEEATEKSRVQADELDRLAGELSTEKDLKNTAETRLSALTEEKTRVEEELRRSLEEATEKSRVQAEELDRLAGELSTEKALKNTAETSLSALTAEKSRVEEELRRSLEEATEKSRVRAEELDRLAGELSAEKDLKNTAETSLLALTAEKSRVEEELRRSLEEATEKSRVQVEELDRLAGELSAEKDLKNTAENNLSALTEEKVRVEEELRRSLEDAREKIRVQDDELTTVSDDLTAEKDRRTAAEQWIETLLQEKLQREATLGGEKESLREQRDALQDKMNAATAALGAEQQKNVTLAGELRNLKEAKNRADAGMLRANEELDAIKNALAEEKQRCILLETRLSETQGSQDEAIITYRKELEQLQQETNSLRTELARVSHEHETITISESTLKEELSAATLSKKQADEAILSIRADLEQVQNDLRTQKTLHTDAKAALQQVTQEKNRIEEKLNAVTAEKLSLDDSRSARLQRQKEELETTLGRLRSLETQLHAATTGLEEKDTEIRALSDRLEELGNALNEEKERRRSAEEELSEARERFKKEQEPVVHAAKPVVVPPAIAPVVIKTSGLPRIVPATPRAISIVETPHEDIRPVHVTTGSPGITPVKAPAENNETIIRGVEDLFEDIPEVDIQELPDASPVPADVPDDHDNVGNDIAAPAGDNVPAGQDRDAEEESCEYHVPEEEHETPGDTGIGTETVTGEAVEESVLEPPLADMYRPAPYPPGMMFDRRQWFDLVKWAHNAQDLPHADKLRIVRMGRVIQRGRLSRKQEEQVREILALAYSMGYKPE